MSEEGAEPNRSSLGSVTSSLYEHVEENGRTYHRYKSGSTSTLAIYHLPLSLVSGAGSARAAS
jgi:hypothetical protein